MRAWRAVKRRRFPAAQDRLRFGALLGREVDVILLAHGHRSGVARTGQTASLASAQPSVKFAMSVY